MRVGGLLFLAAGVWSPDALADQKKPPAKKGSDIEVACADTRLRFATWCAKQYPDTAERYKFDNCLKNADKEYQTCIRKVTSGTPAKNFPGSTNSGGAEPEKTPPTGKGDAGGTGGGAAKP